MRPLLPEMSAAPRAARRKREKGRSNGSLIGARLLLKGGCDLLRRESWQNKVRKRKYVKVIAKCRRAS